MGEPGLLDYRFKRAAFEIAVVAGKCDAQVFFGRVLENAVAAGSVVNEKTGLLWGTKHCGEGGLPADGDSCRFESDCDLLFNGIGCDFLVGRNWLTVFAEAFEIRA
jgi:hypothetical protein